ncbi:cytochrome d ubiquinol oxidase subunit II [Kribbella sp. NPDC055071]
MPHTLWLILLGGLLMGYLTLDGATFGVGMLRLWLTRDEAERRLTLNVIGPFFLGSEVWIVATVGVLFGAFPTLEGSLLTAYYPLVVLIVGSLIARDAGIWFRSRSGNSWWRSRWDRTIAVASVLLPMGWGLLLGNLAQAVPVEHGAPLGASLFDPFALLCGLSLALLSACHGAAFMMLRSPQPLSARAARVSQRLAVPAAIALAASVALGTFSALGIVTAVFALAAVLALFVVRRPAPAPGHWITFGCTALSIMLPIIGIAVGVAPAVRAMAAPAATLAVLGGFLIVVLPVMAAAQLWLWRTFHGRLAITSPMYF